MLDSPKKNEVLSGLSKTQMLHTCKYP